MTSASAAHSPPPARRRLVCASAHRLERSVHRDGREGREGVRDAIRQKQGQIAEEGAVVSICSIRDRNATPRTFSSATIRRRCESDRSSRSSFHTTSTSPCRTSARQAFSPGAIILGAAGPILVEVTLADAADDKRVALQVDRLPLVGGTHPDVAYHHERHLGSAIAAHSLNPTGFLDQVSGAKRLVGSGSRPMIVQTPVPPPPKE